MTPALGVVMVLTAVGFIVVIGIADEAIRRTWRRRRTARRPRSPYDQPTHCRVVDQRQEIRN